MMPFEVRCLQEALHFRVGLELVPVEALKLDLRGVLFRGLRRHVAGAELLFEVTMRLGYACAPTLRCRAPVRFGDAVLLGDPVVGASTSAACSVFVHFLPQPRW